MICSFFSIFLLYLVVGFSFFTLLSYFSLLAVFFLCLFLYLENHYYRE